METVYLGLGANLGERERSLARAIALLEARGAVTVTRVSRIYETEPLEPSDSRGDRQGPSASRQRSDSRRSLPPWYLNAVVEGRTALAPEALLEEIRAVEAALGRTPDHERWSPREIDIDILLFGERVVRTPSLAIPHAGLTARRFVLAPLADLAPHLVVPGTAATVAQHLSALHDPLRVILYAGSPPEERS